MKKEHTQGRINLVEEFRKQFITEDLPGFLYHYTSIENFKGIIDSQEIWATAANFLLNDPTEITIAKSIASKILEERKKDFSEKKELHKKCKTIIESSDTSKEYQFVCSFTEEGDLLSQWRAYCPQGGVSVGFFVPKISKNDQYLEIKNGSPHNYYYLHENYIYKCIYNTKEQEQKINDLLDFLIKHTDVGNGQLFGFFNKMIQTFSYSFKHKSFEEEKEWRLCCFALSDEKQIKYRIKNSMLIPYLPFGIVDKENHSIIRRIIVGPYRNNKILKSSILSYINDSGVPLSSEQIEVTQIPPLEDDSEFKMDEDSKRKYDALQSLNDQYWAEFQEKTRLEWRLSFGLWTSMVMAIGSIFAGKAAEVDIARLKLPAIVFCLVLIVLHGRFLWWIQRRLHAIREYLMTLRNQMWARLCLHEREYSKCRGLLQPTFFVQLGITCVLAAILLASIFYSIPRNVQPYQVGYDESHQLLLEQNRDGL